MITRVGFVALKDGTGKEVLPTDWVAYSKLLDIMNKQDADRQVNLASANDYYGKLNAYQISVDAGRGAGLTPPVKPQMLVTDDNGVETKVDFVPPLPDARPVITPTGGVLFSQIGSAGVPNDDISKKLDLVIQLLTRMLTTPKG